MKKREIGKVKISPTLYLQRVNSHLLKDGDRIAWNVLKYLIDPQTGKPYTSVREGVVVKRLNYWFPRRLGWQAFQKPYWLGFDSYPNSNRVVAGQTRREVLEKLLTKRIKGNDNPQET